MRAALIALAIPCLAQANELADTAWVLGGVDGRLGPQGRRPITLVFDGREAFHGFDGCNGFWGSYTLSNGRLVLGEWFETTMACRDRDGRTTSGMFTRLLAGKPVYVLKRGHLQLKTDDGLRVYMAKDRSARRHER